MLPTAVVPVDSPVVGELVGPLVTSHSSSMVAAPVLTALKQYWSSVGPVSFL